MMKVGSSPNFMFIKLIILVESIGKKFDSDSIEKEVIENEDETVGLILINYLCPMYRSKHSLFFVNIGF